MGRRVVYCIIRCVCGWVKVCFLGMTLKIDQDLLGESIAIYACVPSV